MLKNDRVLRRYYRQVRQMLPCSHKMKKKVGEQLQCSVESYIAEHPEADGEQIVAFFGSPESIAASYVESAGTAEILSGLRIRKRIFALLTAAIVAALLLWATAVTLATVKLEREGAGYVVVTIEELPEEAVIIDGEDKEIVIK